MLGFKRDVEEAAGSHEITCAKDPPYVHAEETSSRKHYARRSAARGKSA